MPSEERKSDAARVIVINLRVAIVVQGAGAVLALLPPHWTTAGIIVAAVGTLLFSAFARTEPFTAGMEQRAQGRRAALTAIGYGSVVLVGGIAAAMTSSAGSGITMSVFAVVPLVLGVRTLRVAQGAAPLGSYWSPRTSFGAVALLLVGYVLVGISSGANSWIGPVLLVLSLVSLPLLLLGVGALGLPKGVAAVLLISAAALIPAGLAGAHPAWLSVAGTAPQNCRLLGVDRHWSERSASSETYRLDCGGRQVEYDPPTSAPVQTDRITVIGDGTGLTGPLRPSEVPGTPGVLYLITLAIAGSALLAGVSRVRATARPAAHPSP